MTSLRLFRILSVLSIILLIGLAYVFTDNYYLTGIRTVNNARDPRWRVVDFNSRQACKSDIYNVTEIPVISKVREVAPRKLRFWFSPPIRTTSWKIIDVKTGKIMGRGKKPEVQFGDRPYAGTLQFIPEGVSLVKSLRMEFDFYPKENYNLKGLSWDDNYYTPATGIPFSLKNPYSLDDWAGFHDDDPEIKAAKKILENKIDKNGTTIERSKQVYLFIMNEIAGADGTPSDEVQSASPLETYHLLKTGKGKGWCENKALVYYLFANAAGIPTRLVDAAGKSGPLKLAGHYFCESWIPEYAKWMYVDPQLQIANITDQKKIPLHSVELKSRVDMDALNGTMATTYKNGRLVAVDGDSLYNKLAYNIPPYTVLAYKFGYPNNKSFNKIKNFLKYTTLLYAPYSLPKWYLVKYFFIYALAFLIPATLLTGLLLLIKLKINRQR